MNKHVPAAKLTDLTIAERLQLMEDIWVTLSSAPEKLDVPSWHQSELDARLAVHEHQPDAARPWAEVRSEILGALRKV